MARYRAGAMRRADRQRQQQQSRYHQGRRVAKQAAQLLKERWGASRVVLFGSLLRQEKVHARTDVDLAVWGLPEVDYLKALAELLELDPDFSIDLVEADQARPQLLRAIHAGIEL